MQPAPLSPSLRRNDNILIFFVILVFAAAIFCLWKGGNLAWTLGSKNAFSVVACSFR